jgi:hypothetical protein
MYGIVNAGGILIAKREQQPEYIEPTEETDGGFFINGETIEGAFSVIDDIPEEAEPFTWYLMFGKLIPIPPPQPTADELLNVILGVPN